MILVYRGKAVFIDCKSVEDRAFTYSMLKSHQIDPMQTQIIDKGGMAGYLISFNATDQVYFFTATALLQVRPKEALSLESGILIGPRRAMDLTKLFEI
jgi:penicillin-binding protein-related factor A (putative recombinase)